MKTAIGIIPQPLMVKSNPERYGSSLGYRRQPGMGLKSVCRGMNPIFMDPMMESFWEKFDPQWESIRQNLGYARQIPNV